MRCFSTYILYRNERREYLAFLLYSNRKQSLCGQAVGKRSDQHTTGTEESEQTLFEFEIPKLVKDFIQGSSFETDYFYLLITYGCHHGGVAQRTQAWLESIGRKADYVNTIIMHDNALIVFDMDQQRSIEAEKQVDAHIAAIKADISVRKSYVQEAAAEEIDFYQHFTEWIRQTGHPDGQRETGL